MKAAGRYLAALAIALLPGTSLLALIPGVE
jgi:hypothetical protein